jgi:hypothetical protein
MITSITNFIPVNTSMPAAQLLSVVPLPPQQLLLLPCQNPKVILTFCHELPAHNTDTPSSHSPTADTTTQFTTSPPPPATSTFSPSPAAKCSHLAFDEESSEYQVSAVPTSLQQATYAQRAATIPPPTTNRNLSTSD